MPFSDGVMMIIFVSGFTYAIGFVAGKHGSLINLFDFSDELQAKLHRYTNKFFELFFDDDKKDEKKDFPSANRKS
ncbi:hypothetical protein [Companilactobacillus mishanensis]|uniref:Uncharacterized protein n=1 Tax=Companilactobacillus mishanensis TaxID=2486008 RepID=A0A5P0ZF03_9LACO|nr:hypothetical protein [Companilactobacillus mishanensis]MQS44275.1 hypothetical protein [Companilactobacillus mishanensis]MQS51622.1 hypothetical protein [Companilactobacillus mishanensis]